MADKILEGPIVRIAADELSFSDIDGYVSEVYGNSTKFTKAAYFYARGQNSALNVFSETDRSVHAAEKRLVSHSLSRRNLLGMQDMINANTQRWIEQLRSSTRNGGWIALWDATRCLTLDTISTFAYGSPEGGLDQADFKHEIFDVFNQIPTIVPAVQNLPLIPTIFKIMAMLNPKFVESRMNEVSLGNFCLALVLL